MHLVVTTKCPWLLQSPIKRNWRPPKQFLINFKSQTVLYVGTFWFFFLVGKRSKSLYLGLIKPFKMDRSIFSLRHNKCVQTCKILYEDATKVWAAFKQLCLDNPAELKRWHLAAHWRGKLKTHSSINMTVRGSRELNRSCIQ